MEMGEACPMSGNSNSNDPHATDKFVDFMRRLVKVPHAEIKAKLQAEKEAKRASRASVSQPKRAT
jgi:hypothetical protein